MKLLFDTHLDLAWNALSWKRDIELPLEELNRREAGWTDADCRGRATTSLPQMRRGGMAVCLATLMARAPLEGMARAPLEGMARAPLEGMARAPLEGMARAPLEGMARAPLEGMSQQVHSERLDYPNQTIAYAVARGQAAYYQRLAECGEIAMLSTSAELDWHWRRWAGADRLGRRELPVGYILAMEGSDGIVEPQQVDHWFALGLRVASLVHYGHSPYAVGTGADGPLTPRGRAMLRAFEKVGILLDVTHLSDTSFDEAIDCYQGPLFASHQNCRALVPGDRQFSDNQIKRVIERGGILGVACDAWMLSSDWKPGLPLATKLKIRATVPIDALADHIDHLCQLAGNCRHAAIGSDLDGGFGSEQTPAGLESIADLQKLDQILSDRGYQQEEVDAIFHGNWLRFFKQHLP